MTEDIKYTKSILLPERREHPPIVLPRDTRKLQLELVLAQERSQHIPD